MKRLLIFICFSVATTTAVQLPSPSTETSVSPEQLTPFSSQVRIRILYVQFPTKAQARIILYMRQFWTDLLQISSPADRLALRKLQWDTMTAICEIVSNVDAEYTFGEESEKVHTLLSKW